MKSAWNLYVLLIYLGMHAQPNIAWQKTIGGQSDDVLRETKSLPNGDILSFGTSNSGVSGDKSQASRGFSDFWIVKMNAQHQIIWQKTVGGDMVDNFSVCVATQDFILLTGSSSSGVSGEKSEASRGFSDYWLVCLDGEGNIVWQKTIGGNYGDTLMDARPTLDGGFIIGGSSSSDISFEKSEAARDGSLDYWILKLSASGNIEWQKTYGGAALDQLSKIIQTVDGGYLAAGYSASNISFDKTADSRGGSDFWILRLDQFGNIIWQKTIGGGGEDLTRDVLQLEDHSFVIAGLSDSDISGEKTANSKGGADFWVVGLDSDGTVVNQATIGGNDYDEPTTICATEDGKLLVGGTSYSQTSGDKNSPTCGAADAWLLKLNPDFSMVWQKDFGGVLADGISYIEPAASGILVSCNSRSDISCEKTEISRGGNDYWVVTFAPDPLNTDQFATSDFSVLPNPSAGSVIATFGAPYYGKLTVTDIAGRQITSLSVHGEIEVPIALPTSEGIYFLSVYDISGKHVAKVIRQ